MKLFWNNYHIESSVIYFEDFTEQGELSGILYKGELDPSKHLVFLYNITTGQEYFYIKKQSTLANVTFGASAGLPIITINSLMISDSDQLFIVFDIDRTLPFNSPNKNNQELILAALVSLIAKDYATDAGLTALINKWPALGQALAAGSLPVVLTAIQQAALTPPAAITDFATETTHLLIKAKTDNIPAKGQALAAASLPVVLTAIQQTALTPPAAITGFATAANQTSGGQKTLVLPSATIADYPTLSCSIAYEAARQVKLSAGILQNIMVYNSLAADQWVQIHNSASAPAEGASPIYTFRVAASANFMFTIPVPCSAGIYVCNSSTGPTKTLGAANCFFSIQYK
jgi:hypothetical protein